MYEKFEGVFDVRRWGLQKSRKKYGFGRFLKVSLSNVFNMNKSCLVLEF
jgi:hypothetical protein